MKKALICFLLLLQAAFGSEKDFHRFTLSNGTDVILYENFSSPVVIVGLIFDVGEVDVPAEKFGLAELTLASVINDKTYIELQNAGISYSQHVDREYSEIFAMVSPKDIKSFFQLIRRSLQNFKSQNIEYVKAKIALREKLKFCTHVGDAEDLISSSVRVRGKNACGMFNVAAFNSLSENDVKEFYRNVLAKSHLSVVVCGAVDKKNVENMLASSIGTLPLKNKMTENICEQHSPKNIEMENKFLSSSLHYVYKIPNGCDSKIKSMAMRIFSYEMFNFLALSNTCVQYCGVKDLIVKGDSVIDVYLIPRMDVSLDSLEKMYQAFSQYLLNKPSFDDEIQTVVPIIKNSAMYQRNDLSEMYDYIKNQILSSGDMREIFYDEDDWKKINSKQIEKFLKEKLFSNFMFKARTRYGADI